jgi:ribonuclease HI
VRAILQTDGGARGNPGPAGIGVVLIAADGTVLEERATPIGETTNNVAEYKALIAGLELALERGVTDIDIHLDSELVVSQLTGKWKIRDERLRALASRADALRARFGSARLSHVRRNQIARADDLANQGMDAVTPEGGGQTSLLD